MPRPFTHAAFVLTLVLVMSTWMSTAALAQGARGDVHLEWRERIKEKAKKWEGWRERYERALVEKQRRDAQKEALYQQRINRLNAMRQDYLDYAEDLQEVTRHNQNVMADVLAKAHEEAPKGDNPVIGPELFRKMLAFRNQYRITLQDMRTDLLADWRKRRAEGDPDVPPFMSGERYPAANLDAVQEMLPDMHEMMSRATAAEEERLTGRKTGATGAQQQQAAAPEDARTGSPQPPQNPMLAPIPQPSRVPGSISRE